MNVLNEILDTIAIKNPRHGKKLKRSLKDLEPSFYIHAASFFEKYQQFATNQGKSLEFGIDSYLRMVSDYVYEQLRFSQTGEYSCKSFADAYEKIYSKPEVMEYYMHGLIMSQFLWKHHYDMFRFFHENLSDYTANIKNYLEVGGGHGFYLNEAIKLIEGEVKYDLLDISESSINISKKFIDSPAVTYILKDIFDYETTEKYNFITVGEVLEHIEEPVELLKKIASLLTEDGHVFITTPTNAPAIDHIFLFHDEAHVEQIINEAGFIVVDSVMLCSENVSLVRATALKLPFLYGAFLKKIKPKNMQRATILSSLNEIFCDILDEEDLTLTEENSAEDVEDWDSLSHIQIIVAIEKHFNIKFTAFEVEQFNNVGDIITVIINKQ